MEDAIAEFRSQMTSLRTAIKILEQGCLSTYFVPRQTLLTALVDINNHLPVNISLIECVWQDNLFKYYQLITVTAIALPNTLRLFIDLPLMNPDWFFDLFEVISFPLHYPRINMFAIIGQIILLSLCLKTVNHISYLILLRCLNAAWEQYPFALQSLYRNYEYALFMGLDAMVAQLCVSV